MDVPLPVRDTRDRLHPLGHLGAREALGEDDAELVQLPRRGRRHRIRRAAAAGRERDDG